MKIAITGNLAGTANEILIGLRREGIEADLFINHCEELETFRDLSNQSELDPRWIKYLDEPANTRKGIVSDLTFRAKQLKTQLAAIADLKTYDIIHAQSGTLNFSRFSYSQFVRNHAKPYLAFATGSDIREVARTGFGGNQKTMKDFFVNADCVHLYNFDMLGFYAELGIRRAEFFPFVINEDKHSANKNYEKPAEFRNKLLCFMMANFDFGVTDFHPNRYAMKNNDSVLKAIAEYVKTDKNIHLIALDRGSDRAVARRMIDDLQISENITLLPEMTEAERIKYLNIADVVFDQFYLGCFGLGALEAMSIGKPLITYVNEELAHVAYGEIPPVLNARTADEIFNRLIEVKDKNIRKEISAKARDFVMRKHSRKVVINKLISIYKDFLKK